MCKGGEALALLETVAPQWRASPAGRAAMEVQRARLASYLGLAVQLLAVGGVWCVAVRVAVRHARAREGRQARRVARHVPARRQQRRGGQQGGLEQEVPGAGAGRGNGTGTNRTGLIFVQLASC